MGDNFDNDIVPAIKLGMNAMHVEEAWRFFGVIREFQPKLLLRTTQESLFSKGNRKSLISPGFSIVLKVITPLLGIA